MHNECSKTDAIFFFCRADTGSQASSAASALIVELHLRLGPKLKSKAARIGAGFVDTCLHHLRTSVSRIRAVALDAAPAVVNTDGGGGGGIKRGSPSDDGGGGRVFEKMGLLLGAGEGWNGSRTSRQHNRYRCYFFLFMFLVFFWDAGRKCVGAGVLFCAALRL